MVTALFLGAITWLSHGVIQSIIFFASDFVSGLYLIFLQNKFLVFFKYAGNYSCHQAYVDVLFFILGTDWATDSSTEMNFEFHIQKTGHLQCQRGSTEEDTQTPLQQHLTEMLTCIY